MTTGSIGLTIESAFLDSNPHLYEWWKRKKALTIVDGEVGDDFVVMWLLDSDKIDDHIPFKVTRLTSNLLDPGETNIDPEEWAVTEERTEEQGYVSCVLLSKLLSENLTKFLTGATHPEALLLMGIWQPLANLLAGLVKGEFDLKTTIIEATKE